MNPVEKFLVCLYSEPNYLAVNILENLLANNCFVNIVTEDVGGWIEKTSYIAAKNRFSVGNSKSFSENIYYSYILFCSGFLDKKNLGQDVNKFLKTVDYQNKKTFFILPGEVYGEIKIGLQGDTTNAGIIYLGDVLGPRIDLQSNLKIPNYLNEIINSRSLTMPVGEILYPIFVSDAAKQLVKWLFAFGPFGKEIFLIGQDTSSSTFWQVNTKLIGEIKLNTVTDSASGKLPKGVEIFRINKDLTFTLTETYKWISLKPVKQTRKPTKKHSFKKAKILILTLLLIFLLPILTLLINGGLSYFSYRQFLSGNSQVSQNLLYVNKFVSNIGYFESRVLKHIPLIGHFYKESEYMSYVITNASKMGIEGIPVVRTGGELISNILGDSSYSTLTLLSGMDGKLQHIYEALSNIEEVTVRTNNNNSFTARYVLSKINFETYKELISQTIIIVDKLPNVLGREDSKTYFVLFENNMELRPTGGFIGSYGLLTFDKGRLSDFAISDVYSADGQLNGHVEPPLPIKQYLGEANWWLRDSNWDPDFPTSAKRAEWFLDKEMDKQVDGVISVDLTPIKSFLKISGPIFLSDYNMSINADNLYEKVQSEVQDDFFAGTHKKASFLTALSRSILDKTGGLSSTQKTSVLKLVYDNLDQRHIQVFLHDSEFQNTMEVLGWDGSVFTPACSGNCYSDLVGIVEANVGVNKSNYFVTREANLDIEIDEARIDKTMSLTLKNSASANLGLSGRYKSYVRLLIPENSIAIRAESSIGQNTVVLNPEITNSKGRKEVGTIVEVLAGETKQLVFYWSAELSKQVDQYDVYIRKQAGVDGYPVNVSVSSPIRLLGSSPTFTLTNKNRKAYDKPSDLTYQCSNPPCDAPLPEGYEYWYNTTLVRDLFARFSY